jgi:hypothetical protein
MQFVGIAKYFLSTVIYKSMKNDIDKEIFYSMNITDIQEVSEQVSDRRLTEEEINLVNSLLKTPDKV